MVDAVFHQETVEPPVRKGVAHMLHETIAAHDPYPRIDPRAWTAWQKRIVREELHDAVLLEFLGDVDDREIPLPVFRKDPVDVSDDPVGLLQVHDHPAVLFGDVPLEVDDHQRLSRSLILGDLPASGNSIDPVVTVCEVHNDGTTTRSRDQTIFFIAPPCRVHRECICFPARGGRIRRNERSSL